MGGGARFAQLAWILLAVAAAIGGRLAWLQVVQHDFWQDEAVKARTRATVIGFRRGAILDRAGRPIATQRATWNVALRFGELRKGAACGQLVAAYWLLTTRRIALADALATPSRLLDELAALTLGELRALEPGVRREDLLWYAAWLCGEESIRPLIDRLRHEPAGAAAWPGLAQRRTAILERVAGERATLCALSRAVGLEEDELVARIDAAIAATDARVLRILEREGATHRFERERELHRELDHRDVRLAANVPHAAVFALAADPSLLPGVVAREEASRVYPEEHDACAPLVGRVGLPDADAAAQWLDALDERDVLRLEPFPTLEQAARLGELDDLLRLEAVAPDEEIGKSGLELAYEPLLRGRRGYRRTENDRGGRVVRDLETVAPRAGADLELTLDVAWQRAAEAVLRRGVPHADGVRRRHPLAFVLLELPRMEVRVLASWPAPGREELAQEWERLAADETTRPLHPRAWRPFIPPPPGSSVKPLVAAFALSAGLIGPATRLECDRNQLRAPGEARPVLCEGLHHSIDVHDALVKSCNHYFARVAHAAGPERMVDWLQRVGLGRATGFASAQLAGGLRIDAAVGEAGGTARREPGGRNLMLLGLGQGKVDVTPLQLAAAMGALALRGWQPPTLIARVGGERPFRPAIEPLPVTPAAWDVVVEAMRGVTLPGGTASPSRGTDLSGFDLATKTGTPQQAGSKLSHSWLAGFFPSQAPRYAFALFAERTGMHGGDACAPLLLELLRDPALAEVAAVAARSEAEQAAVRLALTRSGEADGGEGESTGDPGEEEPP